MFLALLGVFLVAPMMFVGGIQWFVYRFLGFRWLFALSLAVATVCAASLISDYSAPPIYGNRSGYITFGNVLVELLLMQCLIVIGMPLIQRYVAWEKSAFARRDSWQIEQSERIE